MTENILASGAFFICIVFIGYAFAFLGGLI